MANVTKTLFGHVFDFFSVIVTKAVKGWKVSISLLSIIIIFFEAIVRSIGELSPLPFIREVGGRAVSADNNLFNNAQPILANPASVDQMSRWSFTKILATFGVDLWVLLLIFFLLYMIIRMRNSSEIGINFAIAFVSIAVLQIFFNFYLISQDTTQTHSPSMISKEIVPFRGVASFVQALPVLLAPTQSPEFQISDVELIEVS